MRHSAGLSLFCFISLVCRGLPAEPDSLKKDEAVLESAGISTSGPGLLAFLRKHSTTKTDQQEIHRLIHQMGDERFRSREKASIQLVSIGTRATPMLKEATTSRDLEIARRAERCLTEIEQGANEVLLISAARLIAVRKSAGSALALLDYLEGAEKDYLIEIMLKTLSEVAAQDITVSGVLRTALRDQQADRRAAAAMALIRIGDKESKPAIRRMLNDPEPTVRLKVGLALAMAGEREALAPLVRLIGELPASQTGLVEDLLYRLAADSPPAIPPGTGRKVRDDGRKAWEQWLQDKAGKLDLTKLLAEQEPQGHTLAVLLDEGKIVNLDSGKKIRFEIEGLGFPLDAQLLPGDRILVAEYDANRVTERDSKSKILWQVNHVGSPLAAQRLSNGNTFIATPAQLVEVNRVGKEIWKVPPPRGGRIMKATRLRNGDTAVITLQGTPLFHILDRAGKEIRSFAVDQRTSGGRVEVLPSGNVLLAERETNRIVELDHRGKTVWEARFEQPVAAVRLPNGNTLVTSMTQHRAVELDRQGKEVWEYRTTTRVTRAWRY